MTNSSERYGPRRKTLTSRHAVGLDTRLWESRDLITGSEGEMCKTGIRAGGSCSFIHQQFAIIVSTRVKV